MEKINKLSKFNVFIFFLFFSGFSFANGGLSLSQTRLFFNAEMKNIKIAINNQGERVYLINSGIYKDIDENNKDSIADSFLITPPLFRLEGNTQNTLLINKNNVSDLPLDRESVFYLSILAIPSTSKPNIQDDDSITSKVSVGIRMWIKLFYRPESLKSKISDEYTKLVFKQKNNSLVVSNPTPYYLTLGSLKVNNNVINTKDSGSMIGPFSSNSYSVMGKVHDISWSVIDEYGSLTKEYREKYNEN